MRLAELAAELDALDYGPTRPDADFDAYRLEQIATDLAGHPADKINANRDRLVKAVQSIAATLNRSASHKEAAE